MTAAAEERRRRTSEEKAAWRLLESRGLGLKTLETNILFLLCHTLHSVSKA